MWNRKSSTPRLLYLRKTLQPVQPYCGFICKIKKSLAFLHGASALCHWFGQAQTIRPKDTSCFENKLEKGKKQVNSIFPSVQKEPSYNDHFSSNRIIESRLLSISLNLYSGPVFSEIAMYNCRDRCLATTSVLKIRNSCFSVFYIDWICIMLSHPSQDKLQFYWESLLLVCYSHGAAAYSKHVLFCRKRFLLCKIWSKLTWSKHVCLTSKLPYFFRHMLY